MKHVNIIFLICCSSLGLIYLSSCEKIKPISWNLGLNNTKFGDTMVGKKMMGGEIAYIYTPQDPGYSPTKLHGIIVADKDFGPYPWIECNFSQELGKPLGYGLMNTTKIAAACADSSAAKECLNLTYKNYSDWVLPSLVEMFKVYEYLKKEHHIDNVWLGKTNVYWTSTYYNSRTYAIGNTIQDQFSEMYLNQYSGDSTSVIVCLNVSSLRKKVRPIRYF